MARLKKIALSSTTQAVAGRIARAAIDMCQNPGSIIGGISDPGAPTAPPPPGGSGGGGSSAYSPQPGDLVLLYSGGAYTPAIAPIPAGYSCTYDPTRAIITPTGTYLGPIVCTL